MNRFRAHRLLLPLLLALNTAAVAQISFGQILGKQNPLGSVGDTLKQEALKAAISKLLNDQLPVYLDAKKLYPTVSTLPGGPFAPNEIAFIPETMSFPLPPGDYEVRVTAFCTEYSVHRPGKGVAYTLAPLQGKASGAVANLAWRGMFAAVAPQQIMGVTWAIQSGITYDQMPQNYKQLIDQLIPDYKKQISGDFVQQVQNAYNDVAKTVKLPPLDTMLADLGEPGKLMLSAERQRAALLQQNTSDEIKEQTLFAGQETGVYTPVKAEEGPWTVRIPGVAYMRYQINGGNLASDNVLQIRIMPTSTNSVAEGNQAARVVNASYQPQSAAGTASNADTSLFALMGVKQTSNGIDASGMIGYPVDQGAQDLIPVIPGVPRCPPGTVPVAGDVVLYFLPSGPVSHAATIDIGGVQMNGQGPPTVTKVISKWGQWGVYGHDPDDTYDYGTNWAVFHTDRANGNALNMNNGVLYTDQNNKIALAGDYAPVTKDQETAFLNQCPGLSGRLQHFDDQYPIALWPKFDCRGFVFIKAGSFGLIAGTSWGTEQTYEILQDNHYCRVAAAHTGNNYCNKQ